MAYKFNNLMVKVLPEGAPERPVPEPTPTANPCRALPYSHVLNPPFPCQFNPATQVLNPPFPCDNYFHTRPHVILNPPTPTYGMNPVPCELDTHACGPVAPSYQTVLTPSPVIDATPGLPGGGVDQLTALQQQLATLQAHVTQRLEAATAAAKPQTVAEAEDLEKKLQGALDEVRAHKQTLKT